MQGDFQIAWEVMKWPLAACLVLPPLLVYLGLHVVEREVIFVDLALAQVATLGTCVALIMGHDLKEPIAFWISLGVTFLAAALFSWSRSSAKRHVPQEAIIGITFVVAAAGVILLLSRVAGGKEELENLLTGDVLNVTKAEVGQRAAIFAVLAGFYGAFHKRFALISSDPEGARAQGLKVRLWDFLFYAAFALVCASGRGVADVCLSDRARRLRGDARFTMEGAVGDRVGDSRGSEPARAVGVVSTGLAYRGCDCVRLRLALDRGERLRRCAPSVVRWGGFR